ncbi:MAG: transketolase C-terminal domain-containing protein, partial [Candidatus Bilamarchaeaceae archaeon]
LEKEGISASVVDMYSIKPIDKGRIEKVAKAFGTIVTVEDHQIHGGMGSAVAEALSSFRHDAALRMHGIYDRFCESGESADLMKKYALDAEGIANVVREEVKKNKK